MQKVRFLSLTIPELFSSLCPSGIFQKNNSHLQEEIMRQQQNLLGLDGSKYNVEVLSNGGDEHQHCGETALIS